MSGDTHKTTGRPAANWTAAAAFRLALPVMAAALLVDQGSKWAIMELVMQPPRVIEVTSFFNLVLILNPGVSFGLFGGETAWKPWLLSALAVAIVAALFVWLKRQPEPGLALAVGLVAGGATGNIIDRLRFGGVVDFLDFHLGNWHWYAFNLADTAVVGGVAILLLDGLFQGRSSSKTRS